MNEEKWWDKDKYWDRVGDWDKEVSFVPDMPVIIAEARRRAIEECKEMVEKNKVDLSSEMPIAVRIAAPTYNLACDDILDILTRLLTPSKEE